MAVAIVLAQVGGHRRDRSGHAVQSLAAASMFVAGDENSAFSRRFHDLMLGHISDLGGVDVLSAAQMSLVRRMSAMEIQLEELEGRMSRGEPVDLDAFGRASSHLRRIYETLGLQQGRKPRDVSLDLRTYLATKPTNAS